MGGALCEVRFRGRWEKIYICGAGCGIGKTVNCELSISEIGISWKRPGHGRVNHSHAHGHLPVNHGLHWSAMIEESLT